MIIKTVNNLNVKSNINIVVCVHSTNEYVLPFYKLFKNNNIRFVQDRINLEKYSDLNLNIINSNITGNGYFPGRCRDIGAKDIINEDILFFDEDKVPSINPLSTIHKLNNIYDVIVFPSEINDYRRSEFIKPHGLIPRKYYNKKSYVFTCGIYLKNYVINDLRILNKGRIFHPIFDGIWGGEDDFLGDEILALGYKIGYVRDIVLTGKVTDGILEKPQDLCEDAKRRSYLRKALSPVFDENSTDEIEWGCKKITDINKASDILFNHYSNFTHN